MYDRLLPDGAAQIFSMRVEVYVQPPPPTYEFSCVFCYTSCFQVLDECPTCASGVYPICGWSAVNYIHCNMESDCQYDFQVAMDEAAAVEVITPRARGGEPLVLALESANFAVDGAVFVDETLRVTAGSRAQTTTVYDRPLRVDFVARQSDGEDLGCLHFHVFPQDAHVSRTITAGIWVAFFALYQQNRANRTASAGTLLAAAGGPPASAAASGTWRRCARAQAPRWPRGRSSCAAWRTGRRAAA